jgi:hypothetical protein
MKISQLPEQIKELALENIKKQKREITDDSICNSFIWSKSKEGEFFWQEWDKKPIKLGDCLKLENRIIYLELKIKELINTLKTN